MRWLWIDQIIEHVPNKRLCAIKNVSLAEEHLHDHFAAGDARGEPHAKPVMPASLIIEGMAQTAGVLVGSVNHFREKVILAKIVSARIDHDVLPGETLRYEADLERIDAQGASTRGVIKRLSHRAAHAHEWETIGEVELLFSHLDRNMAGLAFPEDNFVFSDNFRIILRNAGMSAEAMT